MLMDWGSFAMFVAWGAFCFLAMSLWTIIVALVIVPRISRQLAGHQVPVTQDAAPGRQTTDKTVQLIKYPSSIPPGSALWLELKEFVSTQPGRTIQKNDVLGIMVGLEQKAEEDLGGATQLMAFDER